MCSISPRTPTDIHHAITGCADQLCADLLRVAASNRRQEVGRNRKRDASSSHQALTLWQWHDAPATRLRADHSADSLVHLGAERAPAPLVSALLNCEFAVD